MNLNVIVFVSFSNVCFYFGWLSVSSLWNDGIWGFIFDLFFLRIKLFDILFWFFEWFSLILLNDFWFEEIFCFWREELWFWVSMIFEFVMIVLLFVFVFVFWWVCCNCMRVVKVFCLFLVKSLLWVFIFIICW